MTHNETKQETKDWLISFVSENQPYTDSAMDELIDLTNEFVDTIEDTIGPDLVVYDFVEFLNERMTDTNKTYFWLKPYDEYYDRYVETQLRQIMLRTLKKGSHDDN